MILSINKLYNRNACEIIDEFKNASLQTVSPDIERANSERLDTLLNSTNFEMRKVKKALDVLDKTNKEYEDVPEHSEARLRIRKNVRATLLRQYIAATNKYKAAQEDYKTAINSKVTRQLKMVKPDLSEDQVDDIIQNGDPNQFIQQTLSGPINNEIMDMYNQVKDKYRDVKKLVRSVKELQKLFEDMAVLVLIFLFLLDC